MKKRNLKIEEVAVAVGVSMHTIENWYRFKHKHPDNEFAQMLPVFYQEAPRQTRYWKQSDISQLLKCKNLVPRGRNGFLGDVTQVYYRKKQKEKKDAEKEN